MKPVVDLDDEIGKTVGRVPRRTAAEFVDYMAREFESLGLKLPYPKGLYRFKTFEEANAWEWKHMMEAAKKKFRARRNQGT